nr:hypothetical protein Iba_chr03fCG0670 [Ipomoea batatas]
MVPILGFPVYLLGFCGDDFQLLRVPYRLHHHSVVRHQAHCMTNSGAEKMKPSPCIGLGLEIHKHGDQPAHGFPEQESRQMLVVIAIPLTLLKKCTEAAATLSISPSRGVMKTGALDRLALLQRQKRLREESAVGGFEIRLRIAHPP